MVTLLIGFAILPTRAHEQLRDDEHPPQGTLPVVATLVSIVKSVVPQKYMRM